jgi:hypothetical protein
MEYSDQAYDFDNYRASRQAKQVFLYALENVPSAVRTTQHNWLYSSAWEGKRKFLTFHGQIKPVMIILRILGVLPYSTTATGKRKFTQRDLQNLLNILKGFA